MDTKKLFFFGMPQEETCYLPLGMQAHDCAHEDLIEFVDILLCYRYVGRRGLGVLSYRSVFQRAFCNE